MGKKRQKKRGLKPSLLNSLYTLKTLDTLNTLNTL